VLARPDRIRGKHPLNSFAALGPNADSLVEPQRPLDVYAPLRILAARDGFVLLIGVGLDRMTLLHLAEEKAGRTLFRRWANGPRRPADGSGSRQLLERLRSFEPILAALAHETCVGAASWRAFPARDTVAAAAAAIREHPELTHCEDAHCLRCRDAVAGGPRVGTGQLSS
jgi:aminoglycoside N3'-acetyltransferase